MPYQNDELYHYGVKGMKWGVRKKYQNADGSLNDRGVKKYAKKAYAKDQLRNEGRIGRAYDRVTGAHKMSANVQYGLNSKAQNRKAANEYVKSMNKSSSKKPNKSNKPQSKSMQNIKNGAKKTSNEVKRVLSDYQKHPTLAARDAIRIYTAYDTAKFLAGPALKKGKKAADRAMQRYYDKHPTVIY